MSRQRGARRATSRPPLLRISWWRSHPGASVLAVAVILAGVLAGATLWSDGSDGATEPDAATVALGASLYAESCASCHGASGEGFARADVPAPPLDGSAHSWHHSDAQILGLIRDGGSIMPAVGRDWTEAQRTAVLTHVKTRWEPWQRERQPGTIGE